MRAIVLFLIFLWSILGISSQTWAGEFPFTDIPPSSPYRQAVQYLYDQMIITDDGSHLFRPQDTITRDTFVGLSVSVSCRKCISPTPTDIIRYTTSPFVDLTQGNPYFYCIAYAAEKSIVQGYIPDSSGTSRCQNGKTYTSNPFCENNNTTRIEAAAMLLRQALLWDDERNKTIERTQEIRDVDTYWYGYALKGIEASILELKTNNTLSPDEYISRGEFALMAAKILAYNQCQKDTTENTLASQIKLIGSNGREMNTPVAPLGSSGKLIAVTGEGTWNYTWTLTHPSTQTTYAGEGKEYPISQMNKCGTWIAVLDVLDPGSGKKVSSSVSTIQISCPAKDTGIENSNLSTNIQASPLISAVGTTVYFSGIVAGGGGEITYSWNFGDGTTSKEKYPRHIYETPGTHTVTLTVTDKSGKTASSIVVIKSTGERDTDKDGVIDAYDQCPNVIGIQENAGCPKIIPFNPDTITTPTTGTTPGERLPNIPLSHTCLISKMQNTGIIIALPNCLSCPCDYTIKTSALVRSCDVLFPTILSADQKQVFSRGGFYQIP